jgi:hypothetical protein
MAYFCKLVKKILFFLFRATSTADTDQFKVKNKHSRQPLPDKMKRFGAS